MDVFASAVRPACLVLVLCLAAVFNVATSQAAAAESPAVSSNSAATSAGTFVEAAQPSASNSQESFAFDQLGSRADQLQSTANHIVPTARGARLTAVTQDLEAEATSEGLWLKSVADEDHGRPNVFGVRASAVRRLTASGNCESQLELSARGVVHAAAEVAMWMRDGMVEEYRVSADGVRQDFILPQRPPGAGPSLELDLAVSGARAEAAAYGAKLTVLATGRELAYSRLKVTDSSGRELTARLAAPAPDRMRVTVDDAGAVYPVRIDPTFSDADWISLGGLTGANNSIQAVVYDGAGSLYIGGSFTIVGNAVASRVARWSGSTWSALGTGMNDTVQELAFAGGILYAGGDFTTAGGVTVNRIARWDGATWSAFGTGMNGPVYAITIVGNDLYAGGAFTTAGGVSANRVAKWSSGGPWSALGTGMNNSVYALAHNGTYLVAGGIFTTAGGVTAGNIAKWSGSAWSDVSAGTNGAVHALAVLGNDVYAGGVFTLAGGGPTNRIAKWVGTGGFWTTVGAGLDDAVYAVTVSGSDVYVAGDFTTAGGGAANRIAKWNGSAWSAVGTGTGPNNSIYALAINGGDVYAAGNFTSVSGVPAGFIANWNGSAWSPMNGSTPGPNGLVLALAASGGDLYVGGEFSTVGGASANNIAKWDGSSWSALGAGVNNDVHALLLFGGDLYAGGQFTTAGGAGANYIAKWNGSAWSTLGAGMSSSVYALAVSGGDLYAAGGFTTAGGAAAGRIAKWNGSSWSALGTGMDSWINALAVSGSDLYAGGVFSNAGGVPASSVARWNGSAWSALGSGVLGEVKALAVLGSDLYVGGNFDTVGGSSINALARWNGSAWSAVGSGIPTPHDVFALTVSGTELFAGGTFSVGGGAAWNYIARWDGSAWSALGSGMDNFVYALTPSGTSLYAGGFFKIAGGKVSAYVAKANLGPPPPTLTLGSATAITLTGAKLNGTVNPNGQATTAQFEYGLTTSYGDGTAGVTLSPNDGSAAQSVSATIGGLAANTLYHYRLTATNAAGASQTSDGTFTTGEAEIAVEQPAGSDLTDGSSTVAFGSAQVGASVVRTFTIRNTGDVNLSEIVITKSGAEAADFSVGSPGATSVAPGGSTTFDVTFTPSATGARAAAIHITSNDANENPFDVSLSGTGTTPAAEIVVEQPAGTDLTDGSSTVAYGSATAGASVVKTFTVRNTGLATLSGLAVSKDGADAAEFIVGSLGSTSLAPGGSTTFDVTFSPASAGAKSAAIHVASNDGDENPFDIALSGAATNQAPEIVVEQPAGTNLTDGAATISFGGALPGSSIVRTFTIKNTGDASLTSISLSKDGANAADFTLGTPGATTVAPGGSTTFNVTFNPAAGGFKSAWLHIANSDWDENPFDILLVARGSLQATYKQGANDPFTGSAYAGNEDLWLFNNSGGATDQNTGADGRVIIGGVGGTSYRHELMRFNLSSLAGQFGTIDSATLRLFWNGANSNTGTVQVFAVSAANAGWVEGNSGTGGPAPNGVSTWGHRIRTSQLWAGSPGASTAGTDYINTIIASAAYAAAPTGQAFDLVFTDTSMINSWTGTPNAGLYLRTALQDNQAVFHASESTAAQRPELILGYSPALPEIVVEQPVGSDLADGSALVAFGDVVAGGSNARTFTIRNIGTANLTGLVVTKDGTDEAVFTITTDPVAPVSGPTGSTTFVVQFAPVDTGSKTATIHIASNDGDESPFDITLTGTGTAPEIALHNGANTSEPQLADGQAAVVDFGYTAQGTAVTRDFTIANTGTAALTVSSITAPSGFTVLNAPGAAIEASATHTFQVRLDAASIGAFSGSVTVNSNDSDEAAFDFPVTGIVQNAPFHNWAASSGLSGANLAPTANPAGDGVENLLKYAFNMDPTMSDVDELTPGSGTSGLPTYDTTGSGASSFFRYEFIRRIGSGLIYSPKKSSDLLNWPNLTSTPTVTPIDANWERVVHLEPFDGTIIEELFGRVDVALP